jgi:hypothetical protein
MGEPLEVDDIAQNEHRRQRHPRQRHKTRVPITARTLLVIIILHIDAEYD